LGLAQSKVQFRVIAVHVLVEVVRVGWKPRNVSIEEFEAAITVDQQAHPIRRVPDGCRNAVSRLVAESFENAPHVIEVKQLLALNRAAAEEDT